MDSGLDKNQTELGVLVLAVSLQMLSDSDSLFNKMIKVFRDFWS